MSNQNQHDNGGNSRLSARVVEEGYISLQKTLQTYRQARDQGNAAAGLKPDVDPVVLLQNEVQTFFSLVRPYIKDTPQLEEYWWGAVASYPDKPHQTIEAALDYYREHSVGVWQSQQHTRAIPAEAMQQQTLDGANRAVADGGGPNSLQEWHKRLNLSNTVRILGIETTSTNDEFDGYYCLEGRFAVIGLREVSDWRVTTRKERVQGDGFMAGETATTETREPEPAKKVETAAKMLIEVADELSAIATYKPRGEQVHGTPVPDS